MSVRSPDGLRHRWMINSAYTLCGQRITYVKHTKRAPTCLVCVAEPPDHRYYFYDEVR